MWLDNHSLSSATERTETLSKAEPSFRYTFKAHVHAHYDEVFAQHRWSVFAAHMGHVDPVAPRPLTHAEVVDLLDGTAAARERLFRLLFAQLPERVKTRHIQILVERFHGSPRRNERRLSQMLGIELADAQSLRCTALKICEEELHVRKMRAAKPVRVLSRFGYPFPTQTHLDRADYLIAWQFAEWHGDFLRLRFLTRLDLVGVFRQIRARDHYRCVWCGQYGDTVDHLIPRAQGGRDVPVNGVASCAACNNRRGSMGLRAWVAALSHPPHHPLVRVLLHRPRRTLRPCSGHAPIPIPPGLMFNPNAEKEMNNQRAMAF